MAFVYGIVAVFSLVLHIVAIRVWVMGWHKCAAFISFTGLLAFMMTAATSLGGMASRADRVQAERQGEIDTKADIKKQIADLTQERKDLGSFKRTTKEAVAAAKKLAETATTQRETECGRSNEKRGPLCKGKEEAETKALSELASATIAKASTERSGAIDAELKTLRETRDGGKGSVGSADPVRALLSIIFGTFAEVMTAWQKAVFAVIYDVCLIAIMVGIEVLGHATLPTMRTAKRETIDTTYTDLTATESVDERPAEPPVALSPKPHLVAQENSRAAGVAVFLAERLQPKPGAMVELEDCQSAYAASKLRPLTAKQFVESLQHFCRACRVKTKIVGDKVYLIGVELVGSQVGTDSSDARPSAQRLGRMGRKKRG